MFWRSQHDNTVQIFPCLLTVKTVDFCKQVNDDDDLKFRFMTMKLCMFQLSYMTLRVVSTILDLGTNDYMETFYPELSFNALSRAKIRLRFHGNTQAGLI